MTTDTTTCTCRRCGRNLDANTNVEEHQEGIIISFRAGYGSVFGDGNVVSCTLCQHCLNDVLGPWLTILEDDPFSPKHKVPAPRGAYQPHQLGEPAAKPAEQQGGDGRELFPELRALYEQHKDKLYGDD